MIREDDAMFWRQYLTELFNRSCTVNELTDTPGTVLVLEMSDREVANRLGRLIRPEGMQVVNAVVDPPVEMPLIPPVRLPFDARGLRTGLRRPSKAERRRMRRA